MMLRSFRDEWSAALRSGEFPQTRGRLHRNNPASASGQPAGYCCLGVRCELDLRKGFMECAPHDGFGLSVVGDPVGRRYSELGGVFSGGAPHGDTSRRWGTFYLIPSGFPGAGKSIVRHMVWMNDMSEKSFTEIADWLDMLPVIDE